MTDTDGEDMSLKNQEKQPKQRDMTTLTANSLNSLKSSQNKILATSGLHI